MAELQHTFAIIKPDVTSKGNEQEVLEAITKAGFVIVDKKRIKLTAEEAGQFYAEHKGKPFYEELCTFMSSGDIIVMILGKVNAILDWRKTMGPTNSHKAREEAPESLRALFGTDQQCNATHGSDSVASAEREIKFFFPLAQTSKQDDAKYLQQFVQPTLVKALTELCREKPEDPISWLAKHLLEINPNKPKVEEA